MTQQQTITDLVTYCPSFDKPCEEARAALRAKGQKCAFAVDMTKETESKIIGGGVKKEQVEVCAISSLPTMLTQLHQGQQALGGNLNKIAALLTGHAKIEKIDIGGAGPPR